MTEVERKFIPSLREGVEVVKMIFFKKLKDYLVSEYPGEEKIYYGMLAGAIINELFGIENSDPKFVDFARANRERINDEFSRLGRQFADLRILLTDALRIHFLCNHQEGLVDGNEEILAGARDCGILLTERDVPLPKGFMQLVYQVGKSYGLIVPQV
jgi:hypothetical protein